MKAISFAPATGRNIRIGRRALGRSVREALSWVMATLHAWSRRRRDRAELARLDERMLRDIGLTHGDVWREINKPFWRQ